MNTQVPDSFDEVDDTVLAETRDALIAEFDEAYEAGDVATASEVAEALTKVNAEVTQREVDAADQAQKLHDLKAQVHGADEPEDDEEVVEEEPVEPAPAPVEEEAVKEPVAASARKPASASATARRAPKPQAPKDDAPTLTITAAADVPGVATGANMTVSDVAKGFHERAHGLRDGSPRVEVATLHVPVTASLSRDDGKDRVTEVLDRITNPQSLVAAGGWCAPPETIYNLFRLDAADGLLDLPTVGINRGGVMIPDFLALSAADNALWTWTEATDESAIASGQVVNKALTTNVATLTTNQPHGITSGDTVVVSGVDATFDGTYVTTGVTATTFTYAKTAANVTSVAVSPPGRWQDTTAEATKPCLRIPCPGFTEYTLEAEGLCVTHGNLSNRAWPELTTDFVGLVVNAHLHRLSQIRLGKITAAITTASNNVTVPDGLSDTYGNTYDALALEAADMRSQYKMAENSIIEAILPMWVLDAMRTGLAKRHGVDLISVDEARVRGAFANVGIRPQFVHALNPLYVGSNRTAWPTTYNAVMYPAGSYFAGTGGEIDLGVTRDSTLNATNDYTAAWSEEFHLVGRRGPAGRNVTISTDQSGFTGNPAA